MGSAGKVTCEYAREDLNWRDRLPELSPAQEFLPDNTVEDLARLGL